MKEKPRDKKRRHRKQDKHCKKQELEEFVDLVIETDNYEEMKEKMRLKLIYG